MNKILNWLVSSVNFQVFRIVTKYMRYIMSNWLGLRLQFFTKYRNEYTNIYFYLMKIKT